MKEFIAHVKYQNGIEGEFEFEVPDGTPGWDIEVEAFEIASEIVYVWVEEKKDED